MTATPTTRHDLMDRLAEYAKTLGWEFVEWDWKDDVDNISEYQVWVQPASSEEATR